MIKNLINLLLKNCPAVTQDRLKCKLNIMKKSYEIWNSLNIFSFRRPSQTKIFSRQGIVFSKILISIRGGSSTVEQKNKG